MYKIAVHIQMITLPALHIIFLMFANLIDEKSFISLLCFLYVCACVYFNTSLLGQ